MKISEFDIKKEKRLIPQPTPDNSMALITALNNIAKNIELLSKALYISEETNGDGSKTEIDLTYKPMGNVIIFIDGNRISIQDYVINGNKVIFKTAPSGRINFDYMGVV